MALIEGVHSFNEDRSSVRQKQKLADRFAGRKKKGPLIKVNLDFVFRLEFRDDPRGWVNRHGFACTIGPLAAKLYGLLASRATPVRQAE